MIPSLPTVIFGYHGCDRTLADKLILASEDLRVSDNPWDWLAQGVYFWEHDPQRAFDFACEIRDRPHPHGRHHVDEPSVVGAVIQPGRCLNLLDARDRPLLVKAHTALVRSFEALNRPLPENAGGEDRVRRNLDCAVIRMLHQKHEASVGPGAAFQTVRAAFFEGEPPPWRTSPGAGFADKSHIQIAVRDPACILGFFRPRSPHGGPAAFEASPEAALRAD